MTQAKKIILVIVLLGVIGFVSYVVWVNVTFYRRAIIPTICSDSEARDLFQSISSQINLPENAHHLYAAKRGVLMGKMYFGAFSLNSEQECEMFFSENFDISIDDFEKVDELSQSFIYTGPHTWKPEYHDKNWKILEETDGYFLRGWGSYGLEIVFVPEKFRIYFIRSVD